MYAGQQKCLSPKKQESGRETNENEEYRDHKKYLAPGPLIHCLNLPSAA
jgi:hypothetical protein